MVGGGICGQSQLKKLVGPPAQGLPLWVAGAILVHMCSLGLSAHTGHQGGNKGPPGRGPLLPKALLVDISLIYIYIYMMCCS